MKCEEFWEKATAHLAEEALEADLSSDLKSHLEECKECQKEWELFRCGMEGLRTDAHEEEPELFWIEMKNNVRANLKPPKQRLSFLKGFFTWKWAFASASVVLSLVCLISIGLFYKQGPGLEAQDIVAMFDPVPMSLDSVKEEIDRETEKESSKDTGYDPYILCGVSDGWSAVLDEVDSQEDLNTINDISKKRGMEKGNGQAFIHRGYESA